MDPEQVSLAASPAPEQLAEDEALERIITDELTWSVEVRDQVEWRFGRFARALAAFEERRCWARRGFSSINSYIDRKAEQTGVSRSTVYGALWVGRRIAPHMSEEQMKRLGKSKLYLIANHMRDDGLPPPPEMVQAAESMNVEQFEASLKRPLLAGEVPEDLELAKVAPFWVSRQDYEMLREVFELVRRTEGIESRNQALVFIFEVARGELLANQTAEESEVIEAEFTEVDDA